MDEPKKEVFLDASQGVVLMGRGVIGDRSDNGQSPEIANPSVLPSVSKFPFRFPRLHGLFWELCSFLHRIQLVWQRGGTRPLEIGSVYQRQDNQTSYRVNMQTRARILDMQRLLVNFPSCSGQDCQFFLLGWNAGSEWNDGLDNPDNSVDRQYSSGSPLQGKRIEGATILRRA
jgi:hypothetical protein